MTQDNQNNVSFDGGVNAIQNFFDQLNLEVDTRETTMEFMINYFRFFIVTKGRPEGLTFKRSIDAVNRDLMRPVNNKLSERDNVETKKKIDLWLNTHKEFEVVVRKELSKLV